MVICLLLVWSNKDSFAQVDSLKKVINKNRMRINVLDRPLAIHLDLYRFIHKVPSVQVSTSYRLNYRFGFESEVNYYLNTEVENPSTKLDALQLRLSNSKPNVFISGIGKVYFGKRKIQYLGVRMAGGITHIDLERKVCTEVELSTSGEIYRCLKIEDRSLSIRKTQFLYGLRWGFDLPITNRLRINSYFDFSSYLYAESDYDFLEHVQDGALRPLDKVPRTDGLFAEYTNRNYNNYFSYGLKIGYAF